MGLEVGSVARPTASILDERRAAFLLEAEVSRRHNATRLMSVEDERRFLDYLRRQREAECAVEVARACA